MARNVCDHCKQSTYTNDNPFVEMRMPRPRYPPDMCCVWAGHKYCLSGDIRPYTSAKGGVATPEQWRDWIESAEAAEAGIIFLE